MATKHIKGLDVVQLVRAMRFWRKANPDKAIPNLRPDDLKYLQHERIVPTAWYPLDLWVRYLYAVHHVAMGGTYEGMVEMGRMSGQATFTGPHQAYVKPGNPLETIRTVVRHMGSHHDFGEWAVEGVPNGAVVHVLGYEDMCELHGTLYIGWFEVLVELSAAKIRDARILRAPWKGDPAYKLEIRWGPLAG